MSLIFRQLQDAASSTYTYLLGDRGSHSAVLIDPVFEQAQRDAALIDELGLTLEYTLDTHLHADHITAAWRLKRMLGSRIAISAAAGTKGADIELEPGDRLSFGRRSLEALATPGHTSGCMSFVLDDKSMVFTGDALLIRGAGRTDFQQGNAKTLYRSVTTQLFSLPDECVVYPAHDYNGQTASSIDEEKHFNPRLGGDRNEEDFEGYMKNLGLAHPKRIDEALPVNAVCGRIPAAELPETTGWAPIRRTFAGIDEIDPEWVATHHDSARVIDVREPSEYAGPLGHIEGADLIPLGELASQLDEIGRERPIVTVCRSGGRSAQALVLLKRAGFDQVANLTGGMIRWHELGLPVADEA
ncbi:MAG TPA: MBL fold metallo-hydrolase [Gammaproteobacteria bacterium]|nr:MBL fold metallo-hydrolase [Gammaproteobacteria bacterium]